MDLASKLYDELYGFKGVYSVKINIYTARLLIIYDKDALSSEELLSKIESWAKIDYEGNDRYLSINHILNTKNELYYGNQQMDEEKPESNFFFDNIVIDNFFKHPLLISISIGLALLSGQYTLIPNFLLLILLYKLISLIFNSFYKKKLSIASENKSSKEITFNKLNFENSVMKFYDSMVPVIMAIAALYSLIVANYIPLLSIVFLLTFNSLGKSTSLVLNSISNRLQDNGILVISFNNLNKISDLNTIIIDKTQDTSDLDTNFIEHIREHGFYDIHIFTTSFNVESQGKSLELMVFRVSDNDSEKIRYIRSLKKDNKTIALIAKEPYSIRVLNEIDICICISNEIRSFDTDPWDLVIGNNNYNTLGETIDYMKYALEKIYQNQLISLWLNILGIVLSFSKKINLIFIGLLSAANEILVYLNSLRLLNYEAIYE